MDIFQNETGDPSLDHLGRMATDRVTAGLTYTTFVDVVSLGVPLLSREPIVLGSDSVEESGRLQALARANGTGTVVSGRYYLEGDSVQFLAHVTDANTGEEMATIEPVWAAVGTPASAVEVLRDRVMTRLATLTDPRLAKWMRYASQPPTFEAYTEFAEGIELYTGQNKAREAYPHFLRAAALDSTFTIPLIWAVWSGPPATVDSVLQVLARREQQLAPLDRHLFDYHRSSARRDGESALRAIRRVVEIAPGSEYLFKAGMAAVSIGRPREAIEFFTQADPESGWLREWPMYWDFFTRAYHVIGDHRTELEEALRGRRQFPDKSPREELRALAALGRVEEVNSLIDEEYEARVNRPGWQVYLRWEVAAELRAHGYPVAASNLVAGAIERFENSTSEWTRSPFNRHNYARLLILAGRLDESRTILEGLLNEDPPYLHHSWRAELAAILARQGQPEVEVLEAVGREATPLLQATIAAQQGELERAVRMLRVVRLRHYNGGVFPTGVHLYSMFEPLWDYPPFQELIRPKG